MEEKYYAYWLNHLSGIGNKSIANLMKVMGTAKKIYHAKEAELAMVLRPKQLETLKMVRKQWRLVEEYEKLERLGICFTYIGDGNYPKRLQHIPDVPYGIYYKGLLPRDELPAVAIIGARDCSQYGSYVAAELGKYLGERGVQVISGMARGIDGISQQAALEAGGISFGVLGCGVDVCYPASNREIYDSLLRKGGVLSLCPSGTMPAAQNFPPRNRIVSGLADAVVVIEARNKSGTLITVDMALEQGKEVYVMPGRVTDRLSDGCNRLLKQGAAVFLSPEEFYRELCELRERYQQADKGEPRPLEGGSRALKEEKRVLENVQKFRENAQKRVMISKNEYLVEDMDKMGTPVQTMQLVKDRILELPVELQAIYKQLELLPKSVEDIQKGLTEKLSTTKINTGLMRLCLERYAKQVSPGQFCIRQGEKQ
ncbi:MAG: DNA-processing protein DprA [Lachnospiraceae bacterium]|nr:DNA-processing protein DprA [Lachnospiraceae bacterium]